MTIMLAAGTMENIIIDQNNKLTQNDPESDYFLSNVLLLVVLTYELHEQ